MTPSVSKKRKALRLAGVAAACYLTYAVGVVVVITGHELAHFAGAGHWPERWAVAPTQDGFEQAHPTGTPETTLVYYLDHFVPALTGAAILDPATYSAEHQAVAAAWLGPVPASREGPVTLYPFALAGALSLAAGLVCLRFQRLPVFTFGLAQATGGFYTIQHLEDAGLTELQAILAAAALEGLFLATAGFGFYQWTLRHLHATPSPAAPPRALVRGYTVMRHRLGAQFLLTPPSKARGSQPLEMKPWKRNPATPDPSRAPTPERAPTAASTWPSASPA